MFRKTLNQLPRLRGISLQHRSWQFGEELAGLGEPLTVAFRTEIVGPADRRLEVGQGFGEVGVGDNLAAGFHYLKAGLYYGGNVCARLSYQGDDLADEIGRAHV